MPTGSCGGEPLICAAGVLWADFATDSSLLFPRNVIPIGPLWKRRAPSPVAAGLGKNRHVTKKPAPIFPNPLDAGAKLWGAFVGRCL